MAEFVDYIERQSIISEMLRTRQELIEFKASEEALLWWSIAMRLVKWYAAADVPETETVAVPKWLPATPETMPPEKDGASDNLIIRAMVEGKCMIFVGFTMNGKWHTAMAHNSDILNGNIAVTHWMYADDLAEVK